MRDGRIAIEMRSEIRTLVAVERARDVDLLTTDSNLRATSIKSMSARDTREREREREIARER